MAGPRSARRPEEVPGWAQAAQQRPALATVPERTELDRAMREVSRSMSDARRAATMVEFYLHMVDLNTESRFTDLSRGNPQPETVLLSAAEGRRHTLEEAARTRRGRMQAAPVPSGHQADAESAAGETLGWLDRGFLGPEIHGRMQRSPPLLTLEAPSVYDAMDLATRGSMDDVLSSGGKYFPGTNHIVLPDRPGFSGERARGTILHEQLHYASWLGGGHEVRWRDEAGHPVLKGALPWLQEGMTSYFAYQLEAQHGEAPGHASYPYETAVSFYLGKLAGEDAIRSAYLTGDYTLVRRDVDRRLGAGSFDRIMESRTGIHALTTITSLMSEAGVRWTAWEREPLIASCFVGIEMRERSS